MTESIVDEAGADQWQAVGESLHSGDMAAAKAALEGICRINPDLAEGWINLGSVERALDDLNAAAEHLERGTALLSAREGAPDPLLLPAWLSLAEIHELREDLPKAESALRQAFRRSPDMASALIQLAGLKARAGDLKGASDTAAEYCRAAVSILSEKASIGLVRKFRKAIDSAEAVDGRLLLIATREAAAMALERALASLPPGTRPEAVISTTADSAFDLKRADAVTASGEARELLEGPVYGFPGSAPQARDALFTVPAAIGAAFPVFVCTRTAWNDMHIRIRFQKAAGNDVSRLALPVLSDWFRKGFTGGFSDGSGRGFFHSLSRPVPIGERGIRFDLDLGLSFQTAIDDLVERLNVLHAAEPIERVVFGDGLLG